MPETEYEKMNVEEKYKVLRNLHRSYELVSKSERSQIPDSAEEVTGLSRKHLITLLYKPGLCAENAANNVGVLIKPRCEKQSG